MPNDLNFMSLALEEGRKGLGQTAPNPAVGAVVVRRGNVVGKGFHQKAGGPHAEVHALRAAGSAAKGATLYVTLEPCSTQGRTPPCTQAIIDAGIKRCIFACTDPNPAHAGAAIRVLKQAGLEVESGVGEAEGLELIKAFAHVQRTGLPFVSLKLATTLDGRIADSRGRSQWITSADSRNRVQDLRRTCDAILVGRETVRADDPSLLPRPARGKKPLRIIPDRAGKLSLNRKVFSDGKPAQTLVLTGAHYPESRITKLGSRGIQTLPVRENSRGVHWPSALKKLAGQGVQHILCEGGGELAGAMLKAGLVQELHLVTGPKIVGSAGRASVAGRWALADADIWELIESRVLGPDVWSHYRVTK